MNTSAKVAESAVNVVSNDMSVFSLITSADMVGKLVVLVLFLASIWSWAIIIDRYRKYRELNKKIKRFERLFWSGKPLDKIYDEVKKKNDNPLAKIFTASMKEVQGYSSNKKAAKDSINIKDRLLQIMDLVKNKEIDLLEQGLTFLATVGSAAPFIGLFGTVWGIMHSFQSIAMSKNTSLAVVAPGIAEALLATAIGLFAAIPAVICYNFLVSKVTAISNKVEDFIGELHMLLSRAIDEE